MNSSEKTAFRAKKQWKKFRESLIKTRGLRCELTGVKLTVKNAQVHHLRPDLYDDLRPELFKILSPSAHDFVESMAMVLLGNTTQVPNHYEWMRLLGPFLPKPERTVDKYYQMIRESVANTVDNASK